MSGNFELELSAAIGRIEGRTDSVIREILLEIGARVVERSPVGDASYWHWRPRAYVGGHFRANWQYGRNNAPTGELPGTTNDFNRRLNVAVGLGEAASVHYIVNNTPYSIRLENGWSRRQAPLGIVNRVLLEFPGIVAGAVR